MNLILLAAYVWSHGGQTTHIRLEARGNEFTAYVDGQLRDRQEFPGAPAAGGVIVSPLVPDKIESLPSPNAIGRVKVTDLDSNAVLYDEPYRPPEGPPTPTTGTLAGVTGRDYAVDVDYHNAIIGIIGLRVNPSSLVAFDFHRFGANSSRFSVIGGSAPPPAAPAERQLNVSKVESARAMTAMALRPWPFAIVGLLALATIALLLSYAAPRVPERALGRPAPPLITPLLVAILAMGTFVVCLTLMIVVVHRSGHVADESVYLFQGHLLATARTHIATPRCRRRSPSQSRRS